MNHARRKQIADITEILDAQLSLIEDVKSDEEESFENMPESFRDGERGEAAQAAIDALDSAASSVQEAIDCLGEAGE